MTEGGASMDKSCLEYCLTEQERQEFDQNGYFVVDDVLPPALVEQLSAAVDRVDTEWRPKMGLGPHDRMNLLDFVGKDDLFAELLDWPRTFPKVWGILGWHIQLYHSHLTVTPPLPADAPLAKKRLGWHQDSGMLNVDLETNPRPRISIKVAFFLTDTTTTGRGNFYVIPGSHLQNKLDFPADGISDPPEALPVAVRAGSAVFFDRRLWHSPSPNTGDETRKVLFYGYSYRWLRPRDDMTVAHLMERSDPIRRQLLGASATGGHGYTSPKDEDVPLRTWLRENLGPGALTP
jgi:ectoine hydroxylase-related dioxygenase (phytanoyl-CoA dioxygenase family)